MKTHVYNPVLPWLRVGAPNELQPAEALMRDCRDKVLPWQMQL